MRSLLDLFRNIQLGRCFRLVGIATSIVFLLTVSTELSGKRQSDVSDNLSTIVGDWRGESACVVRASGCRDEDSEYHFSRRQGKPGWLSLTGAKIVDGKPVTMGTLDCNFDLNTREMQCDLPSGVFRFEVKGDRLEGNMTLKDGTLWRRLSLRKVK
jgi:hypothetical protein